MPGKKGWKHNAEGHYVPPHDPTHPDHKRGIVQDAPEAPEPEPLAIDVPETPREPPMRKVKSRQFHRDGTGSRTRWNLECGHFIAQDESPGAEAPCETCLLLEA